MAASGNPNNVLPLREGQPNPHIIEINELTPTDSFETLMLRYHLYLAELKYVSDERYPAPDLSYFENELRTFLNDNSNNQKKIILKDCLFALHRLVKLKHAAEEWKNNEPGSNGNRIYQAGIKAWQQGSLLLANLLQHQQSDISNIRLIYRNNYNYYNNINILLLAKTLEHAARVTKFNPEKLSQNIAELLVAKEDLKNKMELPQDPRLNTTRRSMEGFFGALAAIIGFALYLVGIFILAGVIALSTPIVTGLSWIAIGLLSFLIGVNLIAEAVAPSLIPRTHSDDVQRLSTSTQKTNEALDEIIQARQADSPFRFFGSWNITQVEKQAEKKQDDFNVVTLKARQ